MPDNLRAINEHLQSRLRQDNRDSVPAVEAAQWLAEAGLLPDSSSRPGLPLRKLLRANRIFGQEQVPPRAGGRWHVRRLPPVTGYHAHIYYDETSRADAAVVREDIAAYFSVRLGRWRDQPVGPHPQAMYQVAFAPEEFAKIVPWLMVHRRGLTVLVHPETGEAVGDHDERALWLGRKLRLRLRVLR
ncbi:MAG: DOPA 4,5-dioxygenase family protein [Rhodospirillales bacterium]|nr:DOPA 4,5-dioxygenase family protein [Rhodospirillales bacterium]